MPDVINKINVGGVDFEIDSSPTPVMAYVEEGTTATRAYSVGEYVIVGETLHKVIASISINDTFVEGTNISSETSLGDEISQINNEISQINNDLTNLTISSCGTEVNLASYTDSSKFVAPKDGFIALSSPANYRALVNIYSSNNTQMGFIGAPADSYNSAFVKKGMKFHPHPTYVPAWCRYYPFE